MLTEIKEGKTYLDGKLQEKKEVKSLDVNKPVTQAPTSNWVLDNLPILVASGLL
jgi:hypothetical protein